MRGLTGSGCRMFDCLARHSGVWLIYLVYYRKIFPPTEEELPRATQSTESTDSKDQTSATPTNDTSTSEPTSKKAKTGSDDIDKDWEAVDKPSEAASEKAPTDISEEGEKVEAPDLGADDGERVEKPTVTEPVDELAESGEVLPKSSLLKDW